MAPSTFVRPREWSLAAVPESLRVPESWQAMVGAKITKRGAVATKQFSNLVFEVSWD